MIDPHLAVFECERHVDCDAGDHVIVVARVLRFEVDPAQSALVFYRGSYHRIGETLSEGRQECVQG
ncbi:MAG: flavin reductase family protein [Bryobacteraceae bacterium]